MKRKGTCKEGSGYSRSLHIPFENDLKGPDPRGRLLATFQEVRLGPLPSFSISAGLVSNRSVGWKLRSALDLRPHSPSGENWICWWMMSLLCHYQRSRRRWVGRLCPRAQAIEIRKGKCLCEDKERNNISPAFDALADPPKRAGSDLESGWAYAEGISIYPLVPTGTSGSPILPR